MYTRNRREAKKLVPATRSMVLRRTLAHLKSSRIVMTRFGLVFLAGILYANGCTAQETPGEQQEILFRVRVSDAGLQAHWMAEGNRPEDFLEARLPGKIYDPPLRFGSVAKENSERDTPIHAAISDFSAFQADEDAWILENFSPEQRDDVRLFLDNPDIRENNRKILESQSQLLVTGEVIYGAYALLFEGSEDGSPVRPLAWKKSGESSQWLRTNDLSDDATFDIVFSALSNGEVAVAERNNPLHLPAFLRSIPAYTSAKDDSFRSWNGCGKPLSIQYQASVNSGRS